MGIYSPASLSACKIFDILFTPCFVGICSVLPGRIKKWKFFFKNPSFCTLSPVQGCPANLRLTFKIRQKMVASSLPWKFHFKNKNVEDKIGLKS